nr:hypothetical protein [uncultured Flavobacterium sp.]
MNLPKVAFFVISTFVLSGCTSDSESDLVNYTPVNTVTYNGTVKAIITENCIMCHTQPPQNGAPMPLLTYENVKNAVLTRGLVDRISSFDPAFMMPFGGTRLPQAKIDQIKSWRDANFPE